MAEKEPLPKKQRLNPTSTVTAKFLSSALAMPDPAMSIGRTLERMLDSSPLQSDKESLIDGAMRVGSALRDAAIRSARKLAAAHSSSGWPLTANLTVKVFSMLDTESVCCAAATCSLFRKCASHPLCCANIDLTRSVAKVSDKVVSTMIQRAGKNLQSIKLGRLPQDKCEYDCPLDKSPVTGYCLSALVLDGGAAGLVLRQLHLYNLNFSVTNYQFCLALSACQSLAELEIVGMKSGSVSILRTICEHCRCYSIKRLCIDTRGLSVFGNASNLEAYELKNLIKKFPLLSSLALRGYTIEDNQLSALIKRACGMKSLDLSDSIKLTGNFLRDLVYSRCADSLETLILRDCEHLRAQGNILIHWESGEQDRIFVLLYISLWDISCLTAVYQCMEEVSDFLSAVLNGDCKALRYMDISNCWGFQQDKFTSDNQFLPHRRCAIDASQISQVRPGIHLIADFPPNLCLYGDHSDASSYQFNHSDTSSNQFFFLG